MWIAPVLIAILVGLLALAFVLYPFYRRGQEKFAAGRDVAGRDVAGRTVAGRDVEDRDVEGRATARVAPTLYPGNGHVPPGAQASAIEADAIDREREEAARAALREIELDYHLGNIEEADYRTLRERYMHRALVALKARQERDHELDDAIEARLQALKEHDMDTNDHAE